MALAGRVAAAGRRQAVCGAAARWFSGGVKVVDPFDTTFADAEAVFDGNLGVTAGEVEEFLQRPVDEVVVRGWMREAGDRSTFQVNLVDKTLSAEPDKPPRELVFDTPSAVVGWSRTEGLMYGNLRNKADNPSKGMGFDPFAYALPAGRYLLDHQYAVETIAAHERYIRMVEFFEKMLVAHVTRDAVRATKHMRSIFNVYSGLLRNDPGLAKKLDELTTQQLAAGPLLEQRVPCVRRRKQKLAEGEENDLFAPEPKFEKGTEHIIYRQKVFVRAYSGKGIVPGYLPDFIQDLAKADPGYSYMPLPVTSRRTGERIDHEHATLSPGDRVVYRSSMRLNTWPAGYGVHAILKGVVVDEPAE